MNVVKTIEYDHNLNKNADIDQVQWQEHLIAQTNRNFLNPDDNDGNADNVKV